MPTDLSRAREESAAYCGRRRIPPRGVAAPRRSIRYASVAAPGETGADDGLATAALSSRTLPASSAGSAGASSEAPFAPLWQPGRIGRLEVKNRLMMAAMFVGYADPDGSFSQRHVDFYEARAEGGAGVVVTESVLADLEVQPVHPKAPVTRADHDGVLPGLKAVADAVHRHGARASFQVSPGQGRQSHFASREVPPKAPSPVPAFADADITCQALTDDEIRHLVEACGEAALRAAVAGFDMVEVHAHTGYLVDQFMTPRWNRRDDAWGGDLAGRMRFPVEIVRAVKTRLGSSFPVGFRLTAEHRIREDGPQSGDSDPGEGGRGLAEALEMARLLEDAGVDALTVDAGCYDAEHWMNPPVYLGEAPLAPLAAAVREAVDCAVIACGSLGRPERAARVLTEGGADFIALGRPFLADPDWPDKARRGEVVSIRPCILCNEYCLGRLPAECMVNAALGRERERGAEGALAPAATPRRVLVVGGGPGGMEAARVAALRGHHVKLYERHDVLGGQLLPAADADYKDSLGALAENLEAQARAAGVELVTGRAVDAGVVAEEDPEVVVFATGAVPAAPPIPGLEGELALPVVDIHGDRAGEVGRRVVVAGGGLNGCDAAVDLARKGHEVTLVDRHDEVGRDMNHISRGGLLLELERAGVTLVPDVEVVRVEATPDADAPAVLVARDTDGVEHRVPADTVAVALGARPENALLLELKDELRAAGRQVLALGDCLKPRKIGEAIHEGFEVGARI